MTIDNNIHEQIFSKSVELWSNQPGTQKAIQNRLGWLNAPDFSRQNITSLLQLQAKVVEGGFQQVVLLGMGGSSLAPEVFNRFTTFLPLEKQTGLHLIVLDGTCPAQIQKVRSQIDLPKTLFIVASKSGGTVETRFLFDYFFAEVSEYSEQPGQHFLAITDSNSALEKLAKQENFFSCFINPSDIGGRYSALSFFGLVPAALLGWDIEKLLDRADAAIRDSQRGKGLGLKLGKWLLEGYNKPTDIVFFDFQGPELAALFMWIEQLVAESLGKRGEGLFLSQSKNGNKKLADNAKCLEISINHLGECGFDDEHASIHLIDEYDIAAHFFHWEFATAIAAAGIGINPFDEPNVAEAKQKTSELLTHAAPVKVPESQSSIQEFLSSLGQSQYLALLVYAEDCEANVAQMQRIKSDIEKHIDIPVTINIGPRYLHSVGQLHKGGKQHGAFLVLLDMPKAIIPIPGQSFGFDKLFCAQALGDFQILTEKGLPTEFITVDSLNDLVV